MRQEHPIPLTFRDETGAPRRALVVPFVGAPARRLVAHTRRKPLLFAGEAARLNPSEATDRVPTASYNLPR